MTQRAEGDGGASNTPLRALIAEDNAAFARTISLILAHDGWETETAADGALALERLDAGPPFDVIISDLRMPVLDGLELLEAVRMRDPVLAGRFAFVTADAAEPAALARLRETGAPVLEKPVSPRALRAMARELCARHDL